MSSKFVKGAVLCTSLTAIIISGCSSDNDDPIASALSDAATANGGLIMLDSARPVDEAIGALQTALSSNDAITALPLIDHQANAASIEETLRPTAVQLFGNPALGTPLMQVNQLAGLDLPQKILAWENEDEEVKLAYNSADYLQQRHGIDGDEDASAALTTIGNALNALATTASGVVDDGTDEQDPPMAAASGINAGDGINTVISNRDMDSSYTALVSAIENAEALRLFAELDHADNAQTAGLELNPTRLVIFGNPNAGTPLMQSAQSVGIDLPQKMLVFENDEGDVTIAWNDPVYLAQRHGIEDQDERLMAISAALEGLANEAAGIAADE
jgi:uncharacterized protein (DUF302 family)